MYQFNNYFSDLNCPKLIMTANTKKMLDKCIYEIINNKKNEFHHKIDNDSEYKRWFTGLGGELALAKFLNVNFVDLSAGQSFKYNIADLHRLDLNIGIKTVEYGKFPLVPIHPIRPEIIIVRKGFKFYICGLATIDILKQYADTTLVLSKKLRARNVKTGFYGLGKLQPFYNIKDLRAA